MYLFIFILSLVGIFYLFFVLILILFELKAIKENLQSLKLIEKNELNSKEDYKNGMH